LDDIASQVAKSLLGVGIDSTRHTAVWAPNCPEYLWIQFGAAKLGSPFILVNAGYRRRELEYLLRQSDASILFLADGAARPGEFIDILYELCPEMILGLSAGTRIVVLDRFRPAETLEALDTGRVSFISGSPTLFLALLQAMTDSKTDSDRVFVADGCRRSVAIVFLFGRWDRQIHIFSGGGIYISGGGYAMVEIKTEYRLLAALSYLLWPVSLLIVMTRLKSEPFLRYHGYQGLSLGLCGFAVYLILGIFLQVFPFFGMLLFNSLIILWFFFLIFLAYRCMRGEYFRVPVIGDLTMGPKS
jgi:uncharacterized membrane protein